MKSTDLQLIIFQLIRGANLGLIWTILFISLIAFSLPESLVLLTAIASLFMLVVDFKEDEEDREGKE